MLRKEATANSVIAHSPLDLIFDRVFHALEGFLEKSSLYLKLEGMNPAGSIKIKPAIEMLSELEKARRISPGKSHIIESSSGNLGIALSIACKVKGYTFTCISDPNINHLSRRYIELYSGRIVIIDKIDENGGYLQSRIDYIQSLLSTDPSYVWLNQYASPANKRAHDTRTAAAIFETFTRVDYLFVGTGTTGTLMGCAEYIKRNGLPTKVIAIDACGSVTFGLPPMKRRIPGLGTSRRPELLCTDMVDDLVVISEPDTVAMCHELLETHSLFVGGSTGTVLAGVRAYAPNIAPGTVAMAISPDFGDRYIDSIYEPAWVAQHFSSASEKVHRKGHTAVRSTLEPNTGTERDSLHAPYSAI